jgi:hypothetical protein
MTRLQAARANWDESRRSVPTVPISIGKGGRGATVRVAAKGFSSPLRSPWGRRAVPTALCPDEGKGTRHISWTASTARTNDISPSHGNSIDCGTPKARPPGCAHVACGCEEGATRSLRAGEITHDAGRRYGRGGFLMLVHAPDVCVFKSDSLIDTVYCDLPCSATMNSCRPALHRFRDLSTILSFLWKV